MYNEKNCNRHSIGTLRRLRELVPKPLQIGRSFATPPLLGNPPKAEKVRYFGQKFEFLKITIP
jgi:hypothetical protein